ncbi:pyruvoyl-dependent arginine decarboxylase [Methanobrevibacter cuticularis]|uniref:Pyruvoyl-dependent arginine decarboxylase n=1 Tax=Methanobrevibacter cuticularis TaxID=47311 RepID=A0A166CYR5_9EURY|nr:arginine decarboxylase, pyruvoyl-dependent [Methanobrevibacter cuticularis]KZX15006.1 pyruvoyl-dependent arginine decarboxylase [Methanobrevibacter cuticularis]
MKVAIVSGKAEGPNKLNSFDNALLKARIGDVNLIKVSSMVEKGTEITDLPKLKPGAMVNCVLSKITSEKKGDLISAAIVIAIGDNLGCVAENARINTSPKEVKEEAIDMVKYMMDKRNEKINEMVVEEINHKVEEIGTVVASLVYLNEEIIAIQ